MGTRRYLNLLLSRDCAIMRVGDLIEYNGTQRCMSMTVMESFLRVIYCYSNICHITSSWCRPVT